MMGPTETYTATDLGVVEASTLKQYSVKVSLRRVPIDHRETEYGRAILAGLQHGKHVYQGTAADKRAGRRVANRRAKASRKANRT